MRREKDEVIRRQSVEIYLYSMCVECEEKD